ARNPQSVHYWLLPDRHCEGREFPVRSAKGNPTWRTGQTSGANTNRILRAKSLVLWGLANLTVRCGSNLQVRRSEKLAASFQTSALFQNDQLADNLRGGE